MNITPDLLQLALLAIFNAATTWGVVSTKLAWMRRDIDDNTKRLDQQRDRLDQIEGLVRARRKSDLPT